MGDTKAVEVVSSSATGETKLPTLNLEYRSSFGRSGAPADVFDYVGKLLFAGKWAVLNAKPRDKTSMEGLDGKTADVVTLFLGVEGVSRFDDDQLLAMAKDWATKGVPTIVITAVPEANMGRIFLPKEETKEAMEKDYGAKFFTMYSHLGRCPESGMVRTEYSFNKARRGGTKNIEAAFAIGMALIEIVVCDESAEKKKA